ncbi:MAG: hypothetical protein IJ583_13695 [Firmicutes bacterium]|nr:hypothetical protein [Bacillota bacterium]
MLRKSVLCLATIMAVGLSSMTANAATAQTNTAAVKTAPAYKNIMLNISLGETQVKDLSKIVPGKLTWTIKNKAIATIENGKVTGVKKGSTLMTAKDDNGNYSINVNVLGTYNEIGTKITNENKNVKLKSDSLTIKGYDVTVGPNTTLRLTDFVDGGYTKYSWRSVDESIAKISGANVRGIKAGITQVIATETSEKGNKIFKFNVTVDPNYVTKHLVIQKNATKSLTELLGKDFKYNDYTFTAVTGSAPKFENGNIVTSGTGSSIVEAISLVGGKNYTLTVKVI